MIGYKSSSLSRHSVGISFTFLYVLALVFGGLHHHHNVSHYDDCPVCHFTTESKSILDLPPEQRSWILILYKYIPPVTHPAISLFELRGYCFPNAPPHRFS